MHRLLGRTTALLLFFSATAGAAAEPADCGPAPSARCLATVIFSLAKTLPADDFFRRHVGFADQELAPGGAKTALDYVVWDNPDPVSWEDVDWIARAGRFDRAIKLAKQRKSPVERLGGLLAVATYMLDKNDTAHATRIVDDVERELPSIPADDKDEGAGLLRHDLGEIKARLGQTERAARLIGGSGIDSVDTFLALAGKYPAAASLREQAWREAERVNQPYAWQLLVEDAIRRGDQAEASHAAQRAGDAMEGAIDGDHPETAIGLARILLTAGAPAQSARLIKSWPQWVNGKDATRQSNIVNALVPVLVGLGRYGDVQQAADAVSSLSYRSECLGKAAEEYFRIGLKDVGSRFDVAAVRVAASSPTGEPKLQWARDAALHNLALARAGRGDILGALDVAGELRDASKIYEVTSYIVRRAIDSGHGPVAGPAIEALQQQAAATLNPGLLLQGPMPGTKPEMKRSREIIWLRP